MWTYSHLGIVESKGLPLRLERNDFVEIKYVYSKELRRVTNGLGVNIRAVGGEIGL